MTPFVLLEEELESMKKEALVGHIRWLYAYVEEIKHELRVARVRV